MGHFYARACTKLRQSSSFLSNKVAPSDVLMLVLTMDCTVTNKDQNVKYFFINVSGTKIQP